MIKNLKQTKKLVEKYKEILSEPFELNEGESEDCKYANYGEWLSCKTGFNSSGCTLCKPLTTKIGVRCNSCIWSLTRNDDDEFSPNEQEKRNDNRKAYCVNENFDWVTFSKTWEKFEEYLSKRVEKLESLIKEVEKDELQNK